MSANKLLPIKVVLPRTEDYQAPSDPGGGVKFFGEFSDSLRDRFCNEVENVEAHFKNSFKSWKTMPAVAKVKMKSEATAKSHRPTELFDADTCPIIGANKLGELYVSVAPNRLRSLRFRLSTADSKKAKAQMTALERIEPFSLEDAIDPSALGQMKLFLKGGNRIPETRFRLFRHSSAGENREVEEAFEKLVKTLDVRAVEKVHYAPSLNVFRISDVSENSIATLAAFAGTQSVSLFPDYKIVRSSSRIIGNVSSNYLPPPLAGKEYGVVGIIDSGTDRNNKFLQAWVRDRFDYIPASEQNNSHGSFVAGLIAQGRMLNHNDPRFPDSQSRIVDFVALDKDGEISEYDLLAAIDEALRRFPDVKIWNLSLGLIGECCVDHEFSMLATALDERAEKHGILFVIAAGNYTEAPLRGWPPAELIDDRICPPADAVRAITVGSLAHIDSANSCVESEQPSPFTRRGPGPAYLLKPELSHYGGNCDTVGNYLQTGVISVDAGGHIAENIGTSFASPLVASLAANVNFELSTVSQVPSATLTKALIIHSAFLRNSPIDHDSVKYRGLGIPLDATDILSCTESSATIILQVPVRPNPEFGKRPFPIPTGLEVDGVLRGEIFMTLLYSPKMDRAFGIEYCRSNVNASLGTLWPDPKRPGKFVYNREIHPVPKGAVEGYESDLIKNGFKWSPLKLYYRNFERGPAGATWRLTLDMLNRLEHPAPEIEDLALIITIKGSDPDARIYSELVRAMTRLNWNTQDLEIRSRSRLQN